MVPSEEQHNSIRIDLIRKFNWTRVGTIYLTKAKYTLVKKNLIKKSKIISRKIFKNFKGS